MSLFVFILVSVVAYAVYFYFHTGSLKMLDEPQYEWILKNFHFAVNELGKPFFQKEVKLLLPTDDYFQIYDRNGDIDPHSIFREVKEYMWLKQNKIILMQQKIDDSENSQPFGTFSINEEGTPVITYHPSLLSDPEALIATFAHELAHYKMYLLKGKNGVEAYDDEHFVDLLAVVMGFGVFMVNSALNYNKYIDINARVEGWSITKQGYLSQNERSVILALFCVMKNIELKAIEYHIREDIHKVMKKAFYEVEKYKMLVDDVGNEVTASAGK